MELLVSLNCFVYFFNVSFVLYVSVCVHVYVRLQLYCSCGTTYIAGNLIHATFFSVPRILFRLTLSNLQTTLLKKKMFLPLFSHYER